MKVLKTMLIVVPMLSLVVACNQTQKLTKKDLKTELDSVSYAIGLDISQNLKKSFEDVNFKALKQGVNDGRDSANFLIDQKEIKKVIQAYFQKKQQAEMEKRKAEALKKAEAQYADVKKAGEDFLKENAKKKGVKVTKSGLQYKVIKQGKGEKPTATSKVKVHYKGTLIDGKEFDSSYKRKKPAEFMANRVIKGWTEGLQLMPVGSKYEFYIPQELAYGAFPRSGGDIKPFATLIFEVELLDIVKDKNKK